MFENKKLPTLEDRKKFHDYIEDWIAKGGITHKIQEEFHGGAPYAHNYAEGGQVHKHPHGVSNAHPVESVYPEHAVSLNSTKGRVSNYLSTLRPQENEPHLAFDQKPDQKEKRKTYQKALEIADHPMSVLHKISHGSILPEDVRHLSTMYPEVLDAIQKKVTEQIIKGQLEDKTPPSRKVRLGLSMLMGTNLSSEMTPQNIQAAQAVFKAQQANRQQAGQSKPAGGSKKDLSKSDQSYLTGDQSLVKRSQKT